MAAALSAVVGWQAVAQGPGKLDVLQQRDLELDTARNEQRRASEAEAALRREVETLGEDRRKLSQDLIDTAARVRAVEGRITAAEQRLKPLDDGERSIRKSLDGRRAVIAEVLAALQRIGRYPPPALMVAPEDALRSLRTALLLGAVLPEMRDEAEALAGELAELARVRKEIAQERTRLAADLTAAAADSARMAVLVEERQKSRPRRKRRSPPSRRAPACSAAKSTISKI